MTNINLNLNLNTTVNVNFSGVQGMAYPPTKKGESDKTPAFVNHHRESNASSEGGENASFDGSHKKR